MGVKRRRDSRLLFHQLIFKSGSSTGEKGGVAGAHIYIKNGKTGEAPPQREC